MSNDTKCQMKKKCQMTQNFKWHKMSNDKKCQMKQHGKLKEMTHDT